MGRRILVLGASGFIGQRVVRALHDSGWAAPVAASRRPLPRVSSLTLDATDAGAVQAALAGIDGVVNCVAGSAETITASARALFSAGKQFDRRPRVVHLSTMSVYGSAIGDVDEAWPLRGDLGPYSHAKVEAERMAGTYGNVVCLRPGCVYGAGSEQWSGRIARLLQARRIGDLGAGGDGTCNLVHVDDVVAAVLAALQAPGVEGQAFNLAMPGPPTWNDYFVKYARALSAVPVQRISQRRLKIETHAIAPPLKVLEIACSKTRLKLKVPDPVPPSLARLWRQEIRLVSTRASEALGVRFMPLEAGLADAAACYRIAPPGAAQGREGDAGGERPLLGS